MKIKQMLVIAVLFAGFTAQANAAIMPILASISSPAFLGLIALGFLVFAVLQRKKSLLSLPWAEPPKANPTPISHSHTAKLLRRDVRNNVILYKFIHQRKYNAL